MKFPAIALLAAAAFLPSAYAVDAAWDRHDPTETMTRIVRGGTTGVTFQDDARYILSPLESSTTKVTATFTVTGGVVPPDLKVTFWGDYYGPDAPLATWTDLSQPFTFTHLANRKKYYYLVTGTVPKGTTFSYTLTSNLQPK